MDITVRPSPIHGLGVFARRPFAAGEPIKRIDDSRMIDELHPLQPELGEFEHHQDYYPDRSVLLPFPDRHFNHSCDPNAYDWWDDDGTRYKIARLGIAEGEEITNDYSVNSWGEGDWVCHCGARRCRRRIEVDFFALPLELQEEYLPLLGNWFTSAFKNQVEALHQAIADST